MKTTRPTTRWQRIGTINSSTDLGVGDAVRLRLFDSTGEREELETSLVIESVEDGKKEAWPHRLALLLQDTASVARAGELSDGIVVPVFGNNPIYVDADSDLVRAEVSIDAASSEPLTVSVSGLQDSYVPRAYVVHHV